MSMVALASPGGPRPRYLSAATVAARLGLSPRTVRYWAEVGIIPAFRLGKQWRIEEHALEEWLRQRAAAPPDINDALFNTKIRQLRQYRQLRRGVSARD